MSNKVLVTGLNFITSLGLDYESGWKNMKEGKSGVGNIKIFDASECQTRFAAEVPETFNEYAAGFVKKRASEQMTRITKMCYVCAKEAVAKSRLNLDEFDKSRCAVILGVVTTSNSSSEKGTNDQNRVLKSMNNAMSAWISLDYKLTGPNFTVSSACASSAYAVSLGYEMIKNDQADLVIVGGADSIVNKEEIDGFNAIYALSTQNDCPEKASRPFTKDRDGFVIGEGAGILILESENSAKKRNADVFAEIKGYAITSEAYNIMAPMKDGEGIANTIEKALKNAGVNAGEIDYINAHGTSTTLNDKYETMAIKKVFGERAKEIPVSSTKSMIGHTIGAAGVIELAVTCLSIHEGIITPTINYDNPDPELDLDYCPNNARVKEINTAISNSFAFGGHNAVIIVKKYKS